MQVSAYTDYSLRVLMQAALRSPERVTVDEVARAFGISRNHLIKIVHDLGRGGYLKTYRGAGGGFTLALPPHEIGVGAIVRRAEAWSEAIECEVRREGPCRIAAVCRLRGMFHEASSAFFAVLDEYSIADLVAKPGPLREALGL